MKHTILYPSAGSIFLLLSVLISGSSAFAGGSSCVAEVRISGVLPSLVERELVARGLRPAGAGEVPGVIVKADLSGSVIGSKQVSFRGPGGVLRSVLYHLVLCRASVSVRSGSSPEMLLESELTADLAPEALCPAAEAAILMRKLIQKIPACAQQDSGAAGGAGSP